MKLSKTSAHAALAMVYLVHQRGQGVTQARQVAEHLGLPTDSALKVLQTLSRHRLVQSQLGRSGGYRLQRKPEQVSLLEIVEAIDGPIAASMPLLGAARGDRNDQEALLVVCRRVAARVRAELSAVTLGDLAAGEPRSAH